MRSNKEPKRRNITKVKERIFAEEMVRNGGNQKKAALTVYPNQSSAAAASTGSKMVRRENVRAMILEEFRKQNIGMKEVVNVHKLNILQRDNLNVSQKALETYYSLSGALDAKSKTPVAIQFNVR